MQNNTLQPCYQTLHTFHKTVIGDCKGFVPLRAYAEKGDKRKLKPLLLWLKTDEKFMGEFIHFVEQATKRRMACYCIPGTVMEIGQAKAEDILQMQTILVDIDTGDTVGKLELAKQYLGEPTLIVESGGITEQGNAKLHVYWKLEKPASADELKRLLRFRHYVAQKIDSDQHFQSAHQPIRVAGSIYHKTQPPKLVKIGKIYENL